MSDNRPIGVFDSGLGGLSVVREIRHRLPGESITYLADSAYCPYGGRPLEEIRERSLTVARMLIERDAKIIVVACNTASGAAIEQLRQALPLPIVGLEPAVKPAAAATRVGRVAVLATPATLKTERFHRLVDNHGAGVEVLKIACPGFVELVETGELTGPHALDVVEKALTPAKEAAVDHVVLGCTHYPFLRHLVADVLGDGVQILDSGAAVARQVERVLDQHALRTNRADGILRLLTTGDPAVVQPIAERLWYEEVSVGAAA